MTIIRVIDFETTGTEPPAEVCEVGTCDLHLEEKRIGRPNAWLCGVKEMPPEVRAIHHISFAECDGQTPFDPTDIDAQAVDAVAAHDSEFETKFYTSPVPIICTYKVALRAWPTAPSHSNGALRYGNYILYSLGVFG